MFWTLGVLKTIKSIYLLLVTIMMEPSRGLFDIGVVSTKEHFKCVINQITFLGEVKVETYAEIGDPKEVIYNAVEDHKINLLVIGDNNDGTIKRALLGSLTDNCLQKSKCPVLVVKKPKEDMH